MSSYLENEDIDSIVSQLIESKKYREIGVCEDTVRDVVSHALRKYGKNKPAVKDSKRKLHQIVALYFGDPDYAAATEEIDAAFDSGNASAVRKACASIMMSHISTKERLPLLDEFYSQIFEVTGIPGTLLDLACGLNPLSFPWMGLPTSVSYHAYDIHQRRIQFLNHYFSLQGLQPLGKVQDVLVDLPKEEADVVFIFKEVHRFERRQRGCSLPLFDALAAKHVVVSLPSRNLTGARDLSDHHRALFFKILGDRPWPVTEVEFENELVFCVKKA